MVLFDDRFGAVDRCHEGSPLLRRSVEPGRHVAIGYEKSVAR
jgi:hypothetical protein